MRLPTSFRVVPVGDSYFQLFGELDVLTAPILRDAIRSALDCQPCVTFDVSGLSFMASDGLKVLAEATNAMRKRHGRVVIRGATGIVLRVLDIVDAEGWPGVTIEGSER